MDQIVHPDNIFPFRSHHFDGHRILRSRRYEISSWDVKQRKEHQKITFYVPDEFLRRHFEFIPQVERFFRGGIHLARKTKTGSVIAFIKGAILHYSPGQYQLSKVFQIPGGARPLNVTENPEGSLFFGQYGSNRKRTEVSIFTSTDGGEHWEVAYKFKPGQIRHIHAVQYDPYRKGLLTITGDSDAESSLYLTTDDFQNMEKLASGSQHTRAAAILSLPDGWIVPSDTPLQRNVISYLDAHGNMDTLANIPGSSLSACQTKQGFFVSTAVEPSRINRRPYSTLWGSREGSTWKCIFEAEKDKYPSKFFQFGNLMFPSGLEKSDSLYTTAIALRGLHHKTLVWNKLFHTN